MIECKAGEGWEQEEGEKEEGDNKLATAIHNNTNTNMSDIEESNEVSYILLEMKILVVLSLMTLVVQSSLRKQKPALDIFYASVLYYNLI